jgi:hypothetical protein
MGSLSRGSLIGFLPFLGRKEFVMAIEPKELMQAPRFEGIGSFSYCRPGNEEWKPSFVFEFLGGQISVEVDESEVSNPPSVGTLFAVGGYIRYSTRNAAVSLVSTVKKPLGTTLESLSSEQMAQYARGIRVWGVGVVHSRDSATMGRVTYNRATLKWCGATYDFRKLTPEIYQRIPSAGKFVRFELDLSIREEKNTTGQLVLIHFPSLKSVSVEELSTGSVASSAAAKAAVPPAKV